MSWDPNSLMQSLDNTFTGAQQTLITGQRIIRDVYDGINNYQQATDSRRASAFPPQQSIMANQQQPYGAQPAYQYQQPLQYGYGYGIDQNNMYMSQNFGGGYPSGVGMDLYSGGYGTQQPVMQGYAGFTNPNYGMGGGTNGFGGIG